MQRVTVTQGGWRDLLDMRDGGAAGQRASAATMALYGPIAGARGRFCLAQVGQSLDGRIATVSGDARDVSGRGGLVHLHRCRALVDAVVVGIGTVLADDPRLSVRLVEGPDPVRVVIDCNGVMPADAQMLEDGRADVIVVQADDVPARFPGTIRLPRGASGLCPGAILDALAARGLCRVLIEGGARTIARFVEADLLDRLHVAVAPLIIGAGPSGISLPPVERLSQARRPVTEVYDMGSDVLFDCVLRAPSAVRQCQKVEMPHAT